MKKKTNDMMYCREIMKLKSQFPIRACAQVSDTQWEATTIEPEATISANGEFMTLLIDGAKLELRGFNRLLSVLEMFE